MPDQCHFLISPDFQAFETNQVVEARNLCSIMEHPGVPL